MKCMQQAVLAAVFASGATFSAGAQALTWIESSAGDTLATAEDVTQSPATSVDTIVGALETTIPVGSPYSLEHTDLYRIYISDVATFSATTDNNTIDDTVLYLFNANGVGVAMNDDDALGSQSTLPAGSLAGLSAGYYFLGVGYTGTTPYGLNGDIFPGGTPDPLAGPLLGWTPSTLSTAQADLLYEVDLTGVASAASAVPEPGPLALLLAGFAAIGLRRASKRTPRA